MASNLVSPTDRDPMTLPGPLEPEAHVRYGEAEFVDGDSVPGKEAEADAPSPARPLELEVEVEVDPLLAR